MVTDDFVVAGTCTEQLYGMCESLWQPDLVSKTEGCLLKSSILGYSIMCLVLFYRFSQPAKLYMRKVSGSISPTFWNFHVVFFTVLTMLLLKVSGRQNISDLINFINYLCLNLHFLDVWSVVLCKAAHRNIPVADNAQVTNLYWRNRKIPHFNLKTNFQ